MGADHLVRGIALDARGAGIPVGDDAAGIEHVDRVVDDAVDQQAEATLALDERFAGIMPVRDIAGDFSEPDERAGFVADRFDDSDGPKAFAVLAHTPAFRFIAAGSAGEFENLLRKTLPLILIGEKAREVLADDFCGLVTLDPLGAGIPGCDEPFRVDHVDGIVGQGLRQKAELIAFVDLAVLLGPTAGIECVNPSQRRAQGVLREPSAEYIMNPTTAADRSNK